MSPNKHVIQFNLNILEVAGKNIVTTYINDIRRHLDDRGLKHTFDIVTNEDFYVNNTIMGGGNVTFPYIHFEEAFDSMRDIIPFTGNINKPSVSTTIPIANYDDKSIVDETTNNDEITTETKGVSSNNPIVTRLLSYNPVDLDDTIHSNSNSNSNNHSRSKTPKDTLAIPDNYTGIIHILLTIHVKKEQQTDVIQGGIIQLNHFLESYNKKGEVSY